MCRLPTGAVPGAGASRPAPLLQSRAHLEAVLGVVGPVVGGVLGAGGRLEATLAAPRGVHEDEAAAVAVLIALPCACVEGIGGAGHAGGTGGASLVGVLGELGSRRVAGEPPPAIPRAVGPDTGDAAGGLEAALVAVIRIHKTHAAVIGVACVGTIGEALVVVGDCVAGGARLGAVSR